MKALQKGVSLSISGWRCRKEQRRTSTKCTARHVDLTHADYREASNRGKQHIHQMTVPDSLNKLKDREC